MIEIEQMILRIPNITPEEGKIMSQQIGERIASLLPVQTTNKNIDQLDLQIKIAENSSKDQLVNQISKAIVEQIKSTNSKSICSNNYSNEREKSKPNQLTNMGSNQ